MTPVEAYNHNPVVLDEDLQDALDESRPENYDCLIEWKDDLLQAWNNPTESSRGCLFEFVSPDGTADGDGESYDVGCLTQIRLHRHLDYDDVPSGQCINVAWGVDWEVDKTLTDLIRANDHLPTTMTKNTIENVRLEVFAEVQQRIRNYYAAARSQKSDNP